ncbi:MAG TPA: M67 family metallopeptidase [Acidimicrobiia bacterium]|nr:M67 family metallopeptidase [Acidimicrobiia bacterium]
MSGPSFPAGPRLRLTAGQFNEIVAHCYDGLPDEACGLLGGPVDAAGVPEGTVTTVYPCRNEDASARTYTIDSRDHIKALRAAEEAGGDLIGVFHSHTHTEAYPSETDVRQAVEPNWIYVLVSLKHEAPVFRAYRIVDGTIGEVPVEISR